MSAARAAGVLAWLAALPAAAAVCGADLPDKARQQAQASGHTVAFAPSPWPILQGRHFSVVFQVCPPEGQALPANVRIDADMPLHKHGMNYRPTVKPLGDGRYRAEGLMFHMPGRWRFMFELGSGAQVVRLSRELDVP